MKKPRLRFLGTVAGLAVYLVSGEQVRNTLDIDFTQGGNEAIYPKYVPPGEIWLDDAMHALDRTATAFHEIVERHMMIEHGMTYDDAHEVASELEKVFRRELARKRPKEFDGALVEAALPVEMR
jgi:ribulose-5-phosphate 4-epimerase/fuculose-1-phosphate aldolase